MEVLDANEDSILAKIDQGLLRWAWDIAAPQAKRRDLRIYRGSLTAYLDGDHLKPPDAIGSAPDPDAIGILHDILGPDVPQLSARRLAARFTCSPTHIYALIASGCLEPLGDWRRGPHGSAIISRSSAEKFLIARRIT